MRTRVQPLHARREQGAGAVSSLVAAVSHPHLTDLALAGRVGLAIALGGAIGLEREVSDQPAGLRTHISVALGAALFGVISAYGFNPFVGPRNDSNYSIDVSRVASQVVVGIGFLGAGAIVKEGLNIRGLTTAASLWVTAAAGLATGIGQYLAAALTTGALLVSLIGLRAPRHWLRRKVSRLHVTTLIRLSPEADTGAVMACLDDLPGVELRSLGIRRLEDGVRLEASLRVPRGADVAELLAPIASREDVTDLDTA